MGYTNVITERLLQSPGSRPENIVRCFLQSYPVEEHLDVLTDVLTRGTTIDEQAAALISAAWDHVRQSQIWSTRFGSLEEYSQSIDYNNLVSPVLLRHSKSDRAKQLSARLIWQNWRTSYVSALPSELQPPFWSKHLLSLLAALSKASRLTEAVDLLHKSMKQRPARSRKYPYLMASDVNRALQTIQHLQPKRRPRTDESVAATEIDDICKCAPSCIPFTALLSKTKSPMRDLEWDQFTDWIYSVSWSQICDQHLGELYQLMMQTDTGKKSRWDIIQALEEFRNGEAKQTLAEQSQAEELANFDIRTIPPEATPELDINDVTVVETSTLEQLLGASLDWDFWQKQGYLLVPGYLNYLKGYGIGERVQDALTRYAYDNNGQELGRKCYDLLREMIQQDPLYYAIIVACRPDRVSKFVHCPGVAPIMHRQQLAPPNLPWDQSENGIQSSILLPTLAVNHLVNLVPGSHTEAQPALNLQPVNVTLNPGDLLIMKPTLRRAESTFSGSAVLNLSQVMVGEGDLPCIATSDALLLDTLTSTEATFVPSSHEQQQQQQPYETRLDCASALGEALSGHRDWNDPKVTYQRDIVLGTDHVAARAFVTRIRERLALDFHDTLDLFENSCRDGNFEAASLTATVVTSDYEWPEFSSDDLDLSELFGIDSTGAQVIPNTADVSSASSLAGYSF
ncbi:uncharacterized protein BO72DRAFT_464125 [Aspergillus fijiensis CBS 313.89]|uniref:Uncharacterized protein n=1 Tax=Aspergillus fijiensis CBS 313.89 TaxID=1448319 RepID=A0A8G1RGH0_9EURO|nr:uncharacterized protein BO72DRAFT_464125 [Aspergillus fijiensis CBS 313.89]RAK71066.1 hypothetical protein BO72DRAFT_464125 [Aspergillus fijiensis CBS 313.89]